jgi:L-methionine (R)-S-oxide reductase
MYVLTDSSKMLKRDLYQHLAGELHRLLGEERDLIANAANFSALIYHSLPNLNWAGFYMYKDNQLVLGPFQGKPACIRIRIGQGVCGTAAADRETVLVSDVHAFPGHIACDAASRSEIVVPVLDDGELVAVLDIDSPKKNRFDELDQTGLENLIDIFCQLTDCRAFAGGIITIKASAI